MKKRRLEFVFMIFVMCLICSLEASAQEEALHEKKVVYQNLIPDEMYLFAVVKDENVSELIQKENLLYLDQGKAEADGTLNFTYSINSGLAEGSAEILFGNGTHNDWDNGTVTIPPTCTEPGEMTYHCNICSETMAEEIPAAGHTIVEEPGVDATCTGEGMSSKVYCSVCGEVLEEQTVLPALGHLWDEGIITVEPTFESDGEKLYTCSRCGDTLKETVPAIRADLSSEAQVRLSADTYIYDGMEKKPGVTVTCAGIVLTEGREYQVFYQDNINPGLATVRILAVEGSGYTGEISVTFTIKEAVSGQTGVIEAYAFSNCDNLFQLKISETVKEIKSYAFADNKNLTEIYFYGECPAFGENVFANVTASVYYPSGKAGWSLDKLADYGGNLTWISWDPASGVPGRRNLAVTAKLTLDGTPLVYDGTEKKAGLTVTDGSVLLTAGVDYSVSYKNNINAGVAAVEVYGQGAYEGMLTSGYQILQAEPVLQFAQSTVPKTFGEESFAVNLVRADTDGIISYRSDNVNVAAVDEKTGNVTINGCGEANIIAVSSGQGNYKSGETSYKLVVSRADNKITASDITTETSDRQQKVRIKANTRGGSVTYRTNNKKVKVTKSGVVKVPAKFVGKVRVTIKTEGNANYKPASRVITLTVNPSGTKIKKLTVQTSRKAEIKWTKKSSVTGYRIQYSTNRKFKKAVTTKKVAGASKTRYVTGRLKKGKTYYFRIQTYKKVGGRIYYSKWSTYKKIKVQ